MVKKKVTKEQFVEAVLSGKCNKEIQEMFGITSNTVKAYASKYEVHLTRAKGGTKKRVEFDDEYIVNELKKGTDHLTIAQHFGVARTTLNRYIRERDLFPADIRRHKETSERIIQRELANAKFADPPKKPFKDVVKGQRVVDVSCLYGI